MAEVEELDMLVDEEAATGIFANRPPAGAMSSPEDRRLSELKHWA